jgi:hypothetical protein
MKKDMTLYLVKLHYESVVVTSTDNARGLHDEEHYVMVNGDDTIARELAVKELLTRHASAKINYAEVSKVLGGVLAE